MKVSFETMFKAMEISEGDSAALTILIGVMCKSLLAEQDIEVFEKYNIRGLDIQKMFYDCADGSFTKLIYTLMLLRCNIFTELQVKKNLQRFVCFPFMDDRIKLDCSSFKEYSPNNPNWRQYCREQLYSFERRSGFITAKTAS